jgi:response regulator RpfG family c-di-GMP phosphodiesterase
MEELQTLRSGESCPKARFLFVGAGAEVNSSLAGMLADRGVSMEVCARGDRALEMLRRSYYQGVLCDLNPSGMNGMELLNEVQTNFPELAFVMVTKCDDLRQGALAIIAGASDYVSRPLQADAVAMSLHRALKRKRVERSLEKHQSTQNRKLNLHKSAPAFSLHGDEAIKALAQILNLKDYKTSIHCRWITSYSLELAKKMGCSRSESIAIVRAAYLHDLDKVGFNGNVSRKPVSPTKGEGTQIHFKATLDTLKSEPLLASPVEIVLLRHERFDGGGYPEGLAGKDIPLAARIFAVANALNAMISGRTLSQALSFSDAREEIVRQSGRQFDPEVVEAFLGIPQETWNRLRVRAQPSAQMSSEVA